MFRTAARLFFPNRLDWMIKKTARARGKRVLLAWNRGLGDIPLGLYAIVHRIREFIPDAEITFLTRSSLESGFSMLEGVKTLLVPWKRGENVDIESALSHLGINPKEFDLVIEKPDPTQWVRWQYGKLIPRLKWEKDHDLLWKRFDLPDTYIGVQPEAETNHGPWRNWDEEKWNELFDRLPNQKFCLFGFEKKLTFCRQNVLDLRGKTNHFELLSIIKNKCHALVLPDSGILSTLYYLDVSFPIRVVSLWADPKQGVLKQNVPSPNPQLIHEPILAEKKNLSLVSAETVARRLFPAAPLTYCPSISSVKEAPTPERVACVILAGGQGTRLGFAGPKGLFPVRGKPLFQWLCEKVSNQKLPLAIMTSPLNHKETVAFFEQNHFFGLQIHFFQQEMRPFLDEKRRPMDLKGPNGNGNVFRSFAKAGLGSLFLNQGIDALTVIPVDNPLADPFDPALIAYHRAQKADATLKCVERKDTDKSMGALVERAGKIEIIEYIEMDRLPYVYSNIGQWVFSLKFFNEMADRKLPVHWVQKQFWKGEEFIFDALPFARKVLALHAPRENCYAPIKSKENIPI